MSIEAIAGLVSFFIGMVAWVVLPTRVPAEEK